MSVLFPTRMLQTLIKIIACLRVRFLVETLFFPRVLSAVFLYLETLGDGSIHYQRS